MIKKILIFLSGILFMASLCNAYDLVVYNQHGETAKNSADVCKLTFKTIDYGPMPHTKEKLIYQIRNVDGILILISHASYNGMDINGKSDFITWEELSKNIKAEVLIFDSCFAERLIKQENWLKEPKIKIASTASDFFSYNPKIGENRYSLISVALYTYFVDNPWANLDLKTTNINIRSMRESHLLELKDNHFRLFMFFLKNEELYTSIKDIENQSNKTYPFYGWSTIIYDR